MPVFVDADACPVKEEIYRVARRHQVKVFVVSNAPLRVPAEPLIEMVTVRGGFDAADDWIADRVGPADVAVTTDIPLAERCLNAGARVLSPRGEPFTEDSIGEALATAPARDAQAVRSDRRRPAPFSRSDRSRFLSKLDETLHAILKDRHRGGS